MVVISLLRISIGFKALIIFSFRRQNSAACKSRVHVNKALSSLYPKYIGLYDVVIYEFP